MRGVSGEALAVENDRESLRDSDTGSGEAQTEDGTEEKMEDGENSEGIDVVEESEPGSSNEAGDSGEGLQQKEGLSGEGQMEERAETGQTLIAENIVASGADGNITWTLDSDGLLTVSGTGDFSSRPFENPNLWKDYRDSITSAKFDVTGMTNVRGVFSGWHLTSLDLSGFDTSNITDMSGMACLVIALT